MSHPGPALPEGTLSLNMLITHPQPEPLSGGCPALSSGPQGFLVLESGPLTPLVLRSRSSPWSSTPSSACLVSCSHHLFSAPCHPSLGNQPAFSIPRRTTKRRLLPVQTLQKVRTQRRESQHGKETNAPAPGFRKSPWPAAPFFGPQPVALVLSPELFRIPLYTPNAIFSRPFRLRLLGSHADFTVLLRTVLSSGYRVLSLRIPKGPEAAFFSPREESSAPDTGDSIPSSVKKP